MFHSFGDLCLLSLADEHSTESLTKTDLVRCPGIEASFTNRESEVMVRLGSERFEFRPVGSRYVGCPEIGAA